MCYIRVRPNDYDDYPELPDPKPRPQLKWVIPVGPVDLGASLQGYSAHLIQATALRLCHRFGDNPLSRLPQEVLDQIVTELHRMETTDCQSVWKRAFDCFQGNCVRRHHTLSCCSEDHDEELWHRLFGAGGVHSQDALDPADYTSEQKAEMLDEYYLEPGHSAADYECAWDGHIGEQHAWVNLLCLCKERAVAGNLSAFWKLNNVGSIC
ncbi:hypothetical protein NX059_008333 [Plenodomus lindquistii]|nr:hypothetical protein NX059_008333 [Plenodomus lindquistii]